MSTAYQVTRLESDGDMSHSDKHQLEQAERLLQDTEKELSTLLPRVERLQKTQRNLQSQIRELKRKQNGGYANMQGEKSINSDGLLDRERWKRDSEEMWKNNTTTPPGSADHKDDSGEELSPRDRFMRDTENQWRK